MKKSNLCASEMAPAKPRLSPSIISIQRNIPQISAMDCAKTHTGPGLDQFFLVNDSEIGGTAVAQPQREMFIKMEETMMEEMMMEERDRMKILIAYDGSECAESAIDDLKRAGLPRRAEAIVLTIAEELIPAPTSIGGVATTFAKDLLEEEKDSLALARRARSRIQSIFPGWEILAEAGIGSPGSEIIAKADEWRPDLIVVGSHGRTALGQMFFGSVSQKVVNEARCSVRVARGQIVEPDAPARIIVGIDGSEEADAAVEEIATRDWPDGSEVRIVNSAWTIPSVSDPGTAVNLAEWIARETEQVKKAAEGAAEKLGSAGLKVSIVVGEREPKTLLCSEAEDLMADCIFVGARGMGRLERFLIGSVSLGVAARAHCSVEVVRFDGTVNADAKLGK